MPAASHWISGAASAIALAAFVCAPVQAQVLDPSVLLPGWWGWIVQDDDPEDMMGTCANLPMRIWFTEDGERYNSRWAADQETGYIATSRILEWLPSTSTTAGFLIQYDDEERRDEEGNLVAWYLFMIANDRFVWVRRDWVGSGGSTRPMERCEDTPIG